MQKKGLLQIPIINFTPIKKYASKLCTCNNINPRPTIRGWLPPPMDHALSHKYANKCSLRLQGNRSVILSAH